MHHAHNYEQKGRLNIDKTGKTTRAYHQTKAKTTYVTSKYMHTLSQDVSWLEIQQSYIAFSAKECDVETRFECWAYGSQITCL